MPTSRFCRNTSEPKRRYISAHSSREKWARPSMKARTAPGGCGEVGRICDYLIGSNNTSGSNDCCDEMFGTCADSTDVVKQLVDLLTRLCFQEFQHLQRHHTSKNEKICSNKSLNCVLFCLFTIILFKKRSAQGYHYVIIIGLCCNA